MKGSSLSLKEKPQKLFTLFLKTGAFYHTVPPNNPCMLCGLRKWPICVHATKND